MSGENLGGMPRNRGGLSSGNQIHNRSIFGNSPQINVFLVLYIYGNFPFIEQEIRGLNFLSKVGDGNNVRPMTATTYGGMWYDTVH